MTKVGKGPPGSTNRLDAGMALRVQGARLRTGWRRGANAYPAAIGEARRGKVKTLVDLLIARRPLADEDFDALAEFIEANARKPGGQINKGAHRAALIVRALKDAGLRPTERAIDAICHTVGQETGRKINVESVIKLIQNPERLSHK